MFKVYIFDGALLGYSPMGQLKEFDNIPEAQEVAIETSYLFKKQCCVIDVAHNIIEYVTDTHKNGFKTEKMSA